MVCFAAQLAPVPRLSFARTPEAVRRCLRGAIEGVQPGLWLNARGAGDLRHVPFHFFSQQDCKVAHLSKCKPGCWTLRLPCYSTN